MPRLGSGVPLVGRRDELARLRAALAWAEGGRPRGVLLAGDAGVGKTRLISELTEQAKAGGALVLSGRCIDIATDGLPYLPFADALTPLATSSDPVISGVVFSRPGLGRLLPQLAPVSPVARAEPDAPDAVDSEMRRDAGGNQDLGQLQLFEAVLGALTELGKLRPVVLVVEDIHWADGSTRDLLSFLLARLRDQRLLVVASYRQEDVHRRHPLRPLLGELARLPEVERLDLPPFDDADARRFVEALAEEPLSADTAADIVKRAEGNAFFVEELLASCIECDGIPAGLADVLLSRLERLTPAAQRVIRIASVADRSVSHVALTEVTDLGDAELDEALREAVQHHVLVIDGADYSFRHALLREAVYADLLPGERSRIHAAYAARLVGKDGPRQATLLAYHSLESNDLPTALVASLRAADEAERRGAPGAALRSVEQALRIWDAVPSAQRPEDVDELRLLDMAVSLAVRSGEVDRAISYARSMASLLESGRIEVSTRREAQVWLRLAQVLQHNDGTRHEAPAIIERAWQLIADDAPSETKAWVQARRAGILRAAGDSQEALRSARRAIADAQDVGAGDAEADALVTLAALFEAEGDSEGARGRLREARSSAERVGALGVELRARHYLALSYHDQGELREALEIYREGADRAAETGLTWSDFGLELRVHRLTALYLLGEWQEVDREVGTRDVPREPGEPPKGAFAAHPASEGRRQHSGMPTVAAARTRAIAVHVAVARGRFAEAADLVEYLRENWSVDAQVALEASDAGVELAIWLGEYGTALRRAREGIAWLDQFEPFLLAGIRIATMGIAAAAEQARSARLARNIDAEAAAIAAGEELHEHIKACEKEGLPRAGTMGPEGRAWLARAAAELARLRGKASPALWAEAVEAFGYGAVYGQALCRWRYAEALLADAGSQDRAAEELAAAYRVAQQLAAEPLVDALRDLAHRGRIPLGDGLAARTTTDPLTARERAVLEQVALGHTNRQVGETLYISEKTVSVHLSRVMAKLGASRRTEAVAIAVDRGLLEAPLEN